MTARHVWLPLRASGGGVSAAWWTPTTSPPFRPCAPVVTADVSAEDTYNVATIQAAREEVKRGACAFPVHVVCTAKRHPDLRVDKACRRGA